MTLYENMTVNDVAQLLVDEGVYGEVDSTIRDCIDWNLLADKLRQEGYHYNPISGHTYAPVVGGI